MSTSIRASQKKVGQQQKQSMLKEFASESSKKLAQIFSFQTTILRKYTGQLVIVVVFVAVESNSVEKRENAEMLSRTIKSFKSKLF